MEYKLEWTWDKTPAHQVFIPVHKNNYFKVMKKKKKKKLPVGKANGTTCFWNNLRENCKLNEQTANACQAGSAQAALLTDTPHGQGSRKGWTPWNHTTHQESTCTFCQAHRPWRDVGKLPFYPVPTPQEFHSISFSLMLPYQLCCLGHCPPCSSFPCCP